MVGKYKVITLCGSTRFKDAFMEAQKRLMLEGNIVISVGLFGHSGDDEVWTEDTKEMLDDMRKRKIDMADEIFVISVDGYIGSSTRSDMDPYIQVQDGDIFITKDGTIGKIAIVEGLPKPATLNAGVFVVRPDGRFNVGYFSYLFKGPIFADFVEASKKGSTIKDLNQAKLLKYEIPAAQPDKQEEFASIYAQSDKSKYNGFQAIGLRNIKQTVLKHELRDVYVTGKAQ